MSVPNNVKHVFPTVYACTDSEHLAELDWSERRGHCGAIIVTLAIGDRVHVLPWRCHWQSECCIVCAPGCTCGLE